MPVHSQQRFSFKEEGTNTVISIAMPTTPGLDLEIGIRSAFDDRCDLSRSLRICHGSWLDWNCQVVGFSIVDLVKRLLGERVEITLAVKSSFD